MLILQIETATTVCSVALSENGETIAISELNEPNVHATQLTPLIGDLLSGGGYAFNQLDAVAVSKGPGSYTGLRIGVSVAKGICYAADLPLIAVNTLEAMAQGFKKQQGELFPDQHQPLLIPMLDARRMEVYMAVYNTALVPLRETSASIIDERYFDDLDGSRLLLFGSGADKLVSLFSHSENIKIHTDFFNSASHMSSLATQYFTKNHFEDTAYFEPYYLKDFIPTTPKKRQV